MCRIIALLALLAGNLAERCVAISRACEYSNNMYIIKKEDQRSSFFKSQIFLKPRNKEALPIASLSPLALASPPNYSSTA